MTRGASDPGNGLAFWGEIHDRLEASDALRRAWLDTHRREGQCEHCGTRTSAVYCSKRECQAARKREAHASSKGSGEACRCGCGRVRKGFVSGACRCGCGLPLGPQNRSGYANACLTRKRNHMAAYRAAQKSKEAA